MIGPLIDAVRQRAAFADAFSQSDETLTVRVDHSGEEISRRAARQIHLRVEDQGQIGMAVREDGLIPPLVESALQNARYGPITSLLAPFPSPLPSTTTSFPAAAAMGAPDLLNFARTLRDRLLASGREVETWAERSVGRVDVANTHGVIAGYDVSLSGTGLLVRASTPTGPLLVRLHDSALNGPNDAMVADLVSEVDQRLAPPVLDELPPEEPKRFWLMPRAVAALMVPLCQALLARQVWSQEGLFAGKLGEPVLSPALTLVDDALAPGRPGTRPLDDEGVICRRITVLEQGVLKCAPADLMTASRLGVPATGHGRRAVGGPPSTAWSNLELVPASGPESNGALAIDDGILIRELPFPGGQCSDGRVALSTPWAYKVVRGEIVGRYERLLLKGNAFDWLSRVERVGATANWIGARRLPDLVIAI